VSAFKAAWRYSRLYAWEPTIEAEQNTNRRTNDRLVELEIKASYTEDLIDQLDKVVVRQQEQIDMLIQAITELRQSSTDGGLGAARNLRDDLPPHF
jgi:SlyX protein